MSRRRQTTTGDKVHIPPSSPWPAPIRIPPETLTQIQTEFARAWFDVCQHARTGTLTCPPDRRFQAAAWSANTDATLSAHAWWLSARALYRLVDAADMPQSLRTRLRFTLMQWVEAASPTNFLASNPDAIAKMLETQGQSLLTGMQNLLDDVRRGRLSQSDESVFTLGENLAATPGAVIFQNHLMQVIQYAPMTTKTHVRPLVMVPPCINKYYILDLQAENSLVRYAVQQGMTVFMVSWRNPQATDQDGIDQATWDDYLQDGVLQALGVARDISKQQQINALGFCVGGTLLSAALALARARGQDPVASLTLLTTLLDFQDVGVLGVFVDEWHAQWRDQQLSQGGLMTAHELNTTFSFLRPAELVWNYVADNYLKGQSPSPFDLLYWNADSTNLPGPFFTWYFRHTYLQNRLREPGGVVVDGVPLNLGTLTLPAYIYGSREDHIVPWHAAYASTAILRGPLRFVLGAAGHVAGVINPPAKGRRNYWAHKEKFMFGQAPARPEDWLEQAQSHAGSWWPDWVQWLGEYAGALRRAPTRPGNSRYSVIEPAPGSYVRVRVH